MKIVNVVGAVIKKGDTIFVSQRGYGEFPADKAILPDIKKVF
jgi:hypothetical protein